MKSRIILFLSLIILTLGCKTEKKADDVQIGAILSMTGKGASVGEYAKKGLLLAVEEQNQKGGLLGRNIVLKIEDSKSKGKYGVLSTQKLLSSSTPPDLLYVQLSSVSLPVKPFSEKSKTIMFGLSGSEKLLLDADYTFRNWVAPWVAGKTLAEKIESNFTPKKVGIFYSGDDFGRSMSKWVSKNLGDKKIEVSFNENYLESSLDYKSLILKNISKEVDVIYVVGLGQGLGVMIKQLRELKYEGIIVGDITTPFPNVVKAAGDYSKGVYYLDFDFDLKSTNPITSDFITKFEKKFSTEPKTLSVISYDALKLYFQAVENVKSLDDELVKKELNKINNFKGVFGDVSINKYDIIYPLDFKQLK